ncbi:hypothetical protein [Gramella sp. KN1008]|uniref:hypothetical protein n=1 Tax=Gramella sp. KN1008 TaxID=2529298 RepID=UPI00103CC48E|nr:hypothetical protein [Gramella sp. KN1008]TBW26973.1 hypothetical protein EZJ28_11680 [Gramella sp. KN1008]
MKYYNLLIGLIFSAVAAIYFGYLYKVPNLNFEADIVLNNASGRRETIIEQTKNLYGFFSLERFDFNYHPAILAFLITMLSFILLKPYSMITKRQFLTFLKD